MATSPRLLYIARALNAPVNEYKPGKTRRRIEARMGGMGGQSDVRFEVLRTFETKDEGVAEALLFVEIDRLGLRKYPGTLKELVICELALLELFCEKAVRSADVLYAQSPKKALDDALALSPVVTVLRLQNKFLCEALETRVVYRRQTRSLKQLLEQAIDDYGARCRLKKLGVHIKALRQSKMDLEIRWAQAPSMVKWLNSKALSIPAEPLSSYQLKFVQTLG